MYRRRLSAKSARKPRVTSRSRRRNGRRLCGETDGNTTNTRSRKIATSPITATITSGACRSGGRPVRRLTRYENGSSQPIAKITQASVSHGCSKNRCTKKRVSTGTLPYQITRYCDQKKYIQTIENANCSLATSWTAAGGIEAWPRALARIAKIESRQNAV